MKKCSAVERDPLLAAHEGETLAQFEQELLELGDQGLLQVGLAEPLVLAEPGELEDQRVLHQVGRAGDLVPLAGQAMTPALSRLRASRSKSSELICRSSSRVDQRALTASAS